MNAPVKIIVDENGERFVVLHDRDYGAFRLAAMDGDDEGLSPEFKALLDERLALRRRRCCFEKQDGGGGAHGGPRHRAVHEDS